MIRIGNKEIVFSSSLMLPDDESATLEIPVMNDVLKLDLKFTPGQNSEYEGRWNSKDGIVYLEFVGWRNSIGTAVSEPQKFGEIDGRRLYFQMAHYLLGNMNLVHFYILVGGPNE